MKKTRKLNAKKLGPISVELAANGRVSALNICAKRTGVSKASSNARAAERELAEYFAGKRRNFKLKLAPQGTEFQQRVWAQLKKIPYGKTVSYQELARAVGKPRAVRAVASACGANPIAIVIPCHRVIRSDGSLGGYASGVKVKQALLEFEAAK